MSQVPGVKKLIKFTQELRGSFGRFKTDDSFRLHYLMTSVPIEEIDSLSTASELFRLEKVDFEELIQRDIDFARVQKIANEYLSQGKDRVVFFPPLLACVVLLEDSGAIKRKYDQVVRDVEDDGDSQVLRATWDSDGFQLALPVGNKDSCTRTISWGNTDYLYYEFAAMLRLNPKRAKLVVLDGQHRLEALRLLRKNPEQKSILEGVEIPICLVWAPEAVAGDPQDEDMTRDFRELFVRVNSEPRKVSGHFITLLKDDSYAAMATRQLANLWKETETPDNWIRLHLLEWNTREDERVDKRTRDFSITTVAIIASVLYDHLFKTGIAPELLNLEERAQDFEVIDPEFSWNGLVDHTHGSAIDKVVKAQIDNILVPALDIILRSATPYQRLEKNLGAAFQRLQQKVDENNGSFVRLKSLLGHYIYREEEIFEDSARSAYLDFRKWITIDAGDRVFFYSVFQQALLRFWLAMSSLLKPFGIRADISAKTTLIALDALCFKQSANFLGNERRYTRRVLWKNESVNFGSAWARSAWADLLCVSLLNVGVRDAAVSYLQGEVGIDKQTAGEIDLQLREFGRVRTVSYLSRLKAELVKETTQSYEEFFPEEKANQLRAWRSSSHEAERRKFDAAIEERASARAREAFGELADQLLISTEDLLRAVDVS